MINRSYSPLAPLLLQKQRMQTLIILFFFSLISLGFYQSQLSWDVFFNMSLMCQIGLHVTCISSSYFSPYVIDIDFGYQRLTFEQFTGDRDNSTNVITIDHMTYHQVSWTNMIKKKDCIPSLYCLTYNNKEFNLKKSCIISRTDMIWKRICQKQFYIVFILQSRPSLFYVYIHCFIFWFFIKLFF
jgi:hypothetical protein